MNASFRRMSFTLGSVALLALAAGCAQEERRPVAPVGRTPTFESQLPGEPGAEQRGTPGAREGAPRPGEGMGPDQGGATGAMTERRLCDELSQSASLSADNIPGGVQITATPRSGSDAERLRQIARAIEAHLTSIGQPGHPPHGEMSSSCPLFDIARTGARGRMLEGPDGIRMVFTSEDTAGVPTVRQQAQMFVQSAGEGKVR